MSAILSSMDTVTTLMGNIFTLMTANAYLTVFLAAGLVGVGISIFRRVKRAAR